jgi:Uncharacterised protein family (UPF0203)
MGSSPSTPTDDRSRSDDAASKGARNVPEGNEQQVGADAIPTSPDKKTDNKHTTASSAADSGLTGMALVNHRCRKPERKYRKCLNDYYSREFVTGRSMEQDCQDKFDAYRGCVLRGIKAEIWDKQGLPPPKEGSPLAELDEDD